MEENKQFDFSKILGIIAESSCDYDKIGNIKKDLKINILSDAFYMAIIRWINMGKPVEGLKVYLIDIMHICLNGIISREESLL